MVHVLLQFGEIPPLLTIGQALLDVVMCDCLCVLSTCMRDGIVSLSHCYSSLPGLRRIVSISYSVLHVPDIIKQQLYVCDKFIYFQNLPGVKDPVLPLQENWSLELLVKTHKIDHLWAKWFCWLPPSADNAILTWPYHIDDKISLLSNCSVQVVLIICIPEVISHKVNLPRFSFV